VLTQVRHSLASWPADGVLLRGEVGMPVELPVGTPE